MQQVLEQKETRIKFEAQCLCATLWHGGSISTRIEAKNKLPHPPSTHIERAEKIFMLFFKKRRKLGVLAWGGGMPRGRCTCVFVRLPRVIFSLPLSLQSSLPKELSLPLPHPPIFFFPLPCLCFAHLLKLPIGVPPLPPSSPR